MDIIANKLSTDVLRSRKITVNGENIKDYLSAQIKEQISGAIINVYKFKGSVDYYSELADKEATAVNGDVWNVIESNMNYAWVAETKEWDQLGSTIDIKEISSQLSGTYQIKGDYLSSTSDHTTSSQVSSIIEGYHFLSSSEDVKKDISIDFGNKVFIKNPTSEELSAGKFSDISVVKMTVEDYRSSVANKIDTLSNNVLYIVESDAVDDEYGKVIRNLSTVGYSTSDAANMNALCAISTDLKNSLQPKGQYISAAGQVSGDLASVFVQLTSDYTTSAQVSSIVEGYHYLSSISGSDVSSELTGVFQSKGDYLSVTADHTTSAGVSAIIERYGFISSAAQISGDLSAEFQAKGDYLTPADIQISALSDSIVSDKIIIRQCLKAPEGRLASDLNKVGGWNRCKDGTIYTASAVLNKECMKAVYPVSVYLAGDFIFQYELPELKEGDTYQTNAENAAVIESSGHYWKVYYNSYSIVMEKTDHNVFCVRCSDDSAFSEKFDLWVSFDSAEKYSDGKTVESVTDTVESYGYTTSACVSSIVQNYGFISAAADVSSDLTCVFQAKGNYISALPASSECLGGIKTGFTQNDHDYPLTLDGEDRAYVTVPWTDTSVQYSVSGDGIKLNGSTFSLNYPEISSGMKLDEILQKYQPVGNYLSSNAERTTSANVSSIIEGYGYQPGGDYLSCGGGVVSGDVGISGTLNISSVVYIWKGSGQVFSGTDRDKVEIHGSNGGIGTRRGSYLSLCGNNQSTEKGNFRLGVASSSESKNYELVGNRDGRLMWNGNVIISADGKIPAANLDATIPTVSSMSSDMATALEMNFYNKTQIDQLITGIFNEEM